MKNFKKNICRLAIAQKKTDVKKIIIVQLVYVFQEEDKIKNRGLINKCSIEVKSISGLVRYKVQCIKNRGEIIIFLFGGDLYILNLKKSLFDK